MRWVLIVGGVLVGLVVVVLVVGLLMPAGHVVATRAEFLASPPVVWDAVADWERWGEWQTEITSVERLPDRDGRTVLMTSGSWGNVPMEIVESEKPRRFVTELDGGVFRGRWTYDLRQSDGGTWLTITEEGEVTNPFFRAMMILHDNYATMFDYHAALAAKLRVDVLGQSVVEVDSDSTGG